MVTWIGAVAAGALIWAAPAAAGYCGDGSASDECASGESAPESGTGSEEVPATPPDGTTEEPASPVAEPVPPPAEPAGGEDSALFDPSYEVTGDSVEGEAADEGGSAAGASPGFEAAQSDCEEYDEYGVDCGGLEPGGETDPDPTDTGGEPFVAATSGSGGSEGSASEGSALEGTTSQGSTSTDPLDAGSTSAGATGGALPSTGLGLGGPAIAGIVLLGAGHALRRRVG